MIGRAGVVFRKELRDHVRDRRSLLASFAYALLGPLMVVLLYSLLGRSISTSNERPLKLPVSGAERAPALVSFLREQNVEILPAPADPQAAVRGGEFEVALEIGPRYGEELREGTPATVRLITDRSRQSSSGAVGRAERLLRAYSGQIGALRLVARGVSPAVAQALAVEDVDVSTEQSRAALFLNLLPYFLIFSIFLGGSGVALDSTTGERERRSLEPLLLNPLPRQQIVLGKMLAALLFTLVAVVTTLAAFGVVLALVPLGDAFGLSLSVSPLSLVAMLLVTLPMLPLAVSLQMIVAAYSKGFKEAQGYLQFVALIPALPGIALSFLSVRAELWNMLIPTFGQQLLISQLLRGESVSAVHVALSALITLALGALLTVVVFRLYSSERILFRPA
ncbi:MAG TPA: ABC transporter permease [Roseiflexaceae bacterium]|nr:ABC transporter permease [Roseiflexaceae bacterium]